MFFKSLTLVSKDIKRLCILKVSLRKFSCPKVFSFTIGFLLILVDNS